MHLAWTRAKSAGAWIIHKHGMNCLKAAFTARQGMYQCEGTCRKKRKANVWDFLKSSHPSLTRDTLLPLLSIADSCIHARLNFRFLYSMLISLFFLTAACMGMLGQFNVLPENFKYNRKNQQFKTLRKSYMFIKNLLPHNAVHCMIFIKTRHPWN